MANWPVSIVVYGAGEVINGAGALAPEIRVQLERLARVCTNARVAATAQLDSTDHASIRYVLDPRGRVPVEVVPEVNTGDPAALRDFIAWSDAICPADRLVLVLSGHGLAWQDSEADALLGSRANGGTRAPGAPPRTPGAHHHARALFGSQSGKAGAISRALLMDGHDRDYLSNAELGAVCQRIADLRGRPIDVLVFDACLMSAIEILQEVRGAAATVVGAIDEISAAGIDLAGPAQRISAANGQLDPPGLARSMAEPFTPKAAFDSCVAVDLTAPGWVAGLNAFQSLVAQLLSWMAGKSERAGAVRTALGTATNSIVRYSRGGLSDIGALAEALAALPGAPAAPVDAARQAAAAFRSTVLARAAGGDYSGATGLSVFAPGSATVYGANRADYMRLQFPTLTGWSAVLDLTFGFAAGDSAQLVTRGAPSAALNGNAAEFVVSLRGVPLDAAFAARLEKTVRRTVLEKLAELDVLEGTAIVPLISILPESAGRQPGFAVLGERPADGIGRPSERLDDFREFLLLRPALPVAKEEFRLHVLLGGVVLDAEARALLNAAIRSAVLREIATIDTLAVHDVDSPSAQASTRALLRPGGLPGTETLGFVARLA